MPIINRWVDPSLSLVPPFKDFRSLYLQSPALIAVCACFNRMLNGQQKVYGLFDHQIEPTFQNELQQQGHPLAQAGGNFLSEIKTKRVEI